MNRDGRRVNRRVRLDAQLDRRTGKTEVDDR